MVRGFVPNIHHDAYSQPRSVLPANNSHSVTLGSPHVTLGSPDNFVLELLGLSPRPETVEAETVVAVGHDPEPGLALGLLHDDLHADPARLVLRLGHGERLLHLRLVLLQAVLKKKE